MASLSRLAALRLLHTVGYRHATVHHLTREHDRVVVLFTVPHGRGYRRAFTAFISQPEGKDRPAMEVEPGFVVQPAGETT